MCEWCGIPGDVIVGNPTWRDLATVHPEFVQWVVQTYGPLPEGEVKEEDYERYRQEFLTLGGNA